MCWSVIIPVFRVLVLCCPLVVVSSCCPPLSAFKRDLLAFSQLVGFVSPFLFFVLFLGVLRKNSRIKKRRNQKQEKNTNLIGCPSDQVKDWALATRSGREGEKKEEIK